MAYCRRFACGDGASARGGARCARRDTERRRPVRPPDGRQGDVRLRSDRWRQRSTKGCHPVGRPISARLSGGVSQQRRWWRGVHHQRRLALTAPRSAQPRQVEAAGRLPRAAGVGTRPDPASVEVGSERRPGGACRAETTSGTKLGGLQQPSRTFLYSNACSLPIHHEHVFGVNREIEQMFAIRHQTRYGETAPRQSKGAGRARKRAQRQASRDS